MIDTPKMEPSNISSSFVFVDWYHLPLQVTNKGICWTELNGFGVSQLPGLLARMFNALHSDSLADKPNWLRWALSIRKHVGLLSLYFLVNHILMR